MYLSCFFPRNMKSTPNYARYFFVVDFTDLDYSSKVALYLLLDLVKSKTVPGLQVIKTEKRTYRKLRINYYVLS